MTPKPWTHDGKTTLGRCYIDHSESKTKDDPKFCILCQEANDGQSSSKRTKNSETNAYSLGGSDAHTNYAVNLEQDEEDNEFNILEPVRPVGRDTTKHVSSLSRQTASSIPTTNELAHQIEEFTKIQKTKYLEKKKIHEEKLLRADLKVMGSMPPEELGGKEQSIMRKLRLKIFDKYC
ncbi:hypothetical protein R6Q57_003155 [Mikania cordata]